MAATLSKEIGFQKGAMASYNKAGITLWRMANYQKALPYFQTAEKTSLLNDGCFRFTCLQNQAMCFLALAEYDSAIKVLKPIFSRPESCKWSYGINGGVAEFYAGQAYSKKGEYDSAIFFFNEAITKTRNGGLKNIVAAVDEEKGLLYKEMHQYALALEHLASASQGFIELRDSLKLEECYHELGNIHLLLAQDSLAHNYFRKALKLATRMEQPQKQFGNLHALGKLHFKNRCIDSALSYFEQGVELGKSYPDVSFSMFDLWLNLSKTNFARGNLEEAGSYARMGLDLSHQNEDTVQMVEAHLALAECLMNQEAIIEAMQGLRFSNLSQRTDLILKCYLFLYETYEDQEDHKQALHYLKRYNRTSDSLVTIDLKRKGQELSQHIQVAEKNQKLKDLEIMLTKMARKEKDLVLLKRSFGIAIALCVLLVVVIYFLYWQKNLAQKYSANLKQKKLASSQELLEKDLEHKSQELTAFSLQMTEKDELLEELKNHLDKLAQSPMVKGDQVRAVSRRLNSYMASKADWKNFMYYFNQVQKSFLRNLRNTYPSLTQHEVRLCALLSLNLPNHEIARVMNIQVESLRKALYRLRQKMELEGTEELAETLRNLNWQQKKPGSSVEPGV